MLPIAPTLFPRSRRRAAEAGSAYLVALVVLLVVTVIGLGLAFVTQTELLIGANERVIQRISYAAESGLAVATAHALVRKFKEPFDLELNDPPDHSTGLHLTTLVELGPTYPIFFTPCNLCQINNDKEYNTQAYYRVNHLMSSRATLQGESGTVTARKQMTIMLESQPWDDIKPPTESLSEVTDAAGTRTEFVDAGSSWWHAITP